MNIPDNLLYTKEHEWIFIEGTTGKIGITDYAQQQLGDITYIDIPELEKEVKQFEVLTTIESVKAASDLYAPMSGKVTNVNDRLITYPELLNTSPYGDGWIAVIEIKDVSEKTELMDSDKYTNYIQGLESH